MNAAWTVSMPLLRRPGARARVVGVPARIGEMVPGLLVRAPLPKVRPL